MISAAVCKPLFFNGVSMLINECIINIDSIVVDYIGTVAGMTTDELVAVSQNPYSSDETATEPLLITRILFDRQVTAA